MPQQWSFIFITHPFPAHCFIKHPHKWQESSKIIQRVCFTSFVKHLVDLDNRPKLELNQATGSEISSRTEREPVRSPASVIPFAFSLPLLLLLLLLLLLPRMFSSYVSTIFVTFHLLNLDRLECVSPSLIRISLTQFPKTILHYLEAFYRLSALFIYFFFFFNFLLSFWSY